MKPTGTEAQVCEDIARRQQLGLAKYGTSVADNPLELAQWVQHLYEELLDASIYAKRILNYLNSNSTQRQIMAMKAEHEQKCLRIEKELLNFDRAMGLSPLTGLGIDSKIRQDDDGQTKKSEGKL